MQSNPNPYEPPLPAPLPAGERETVERLGREGMRYAVMSLLISFAALATVYLFCCWPIGILAAAMSLFVGINAYNRSTEDGSRVMAGFAIGLACLTGALAIWTLVAIFVRSI